MDVLNETALVGVLVDLVTGEADEVGDIALGVHVPVLVAEVVDEEADDAVAPVERGLDLVGHELAVARHVAEAEDGYRGVVEGIVDEALHGHVAPALGLLPDADALEAGRSARHDSGKVVDLLDPVEIPVVIEAQVDPYDAASHET